MDIASQLEFGIRHPKNGGFGYTDQCEGGKKPARFLDRDGVTAAARERGSGGNQETPVAG